jgi:ABC-type Mn2+/Zn2+ transport systems, permease components
MWDDFLIRALFAGLGVALIAGPLGCFVIWRRLAYFGDTLSHGALLGVALALLFEIHVTAAVFVLSALIALSLLWLQRHASISSDALLGLLSHSALAIGLVVLAFMTWVRVDLLGLLFGDILAVSWLDVGLIWFGALAALGILGIMWTSLFASTVNRELAEAEGLKPERAELLLMLLLAAIIAVAIKIVGVLLITSLLIIPAAAARRFAPGPVWMAGLASGLGMLAVTGGLLGSMTYDTPTGPSIVVMALIFFLVSLTPIASRIQHRIRHAKIAD